MLIFRTPWKEFQGLTAGMLGVGSGSEESQEPMDKGRSHSSGLSVPAEVWGCPSCSQLALGSAPGAQCSHLRAPQALPQPGAAHGSGRVTLGTAQGDLPHLHLPGIGPSRDINSRFQCSAFLLSPPRPSWQHNYQPQSIIFLIKTLCVKQSHK